MAGPGINMIPLTSPFFQFVLFLFLILANFLFPSNPGILPSCHFYRHMKNMAIKDRSKTEHPDKSCVCPSTLQTCVKEKRTPGQATMVKEKVYEVETLLHRHLL